MIGQTIKKNIKFASWLVKQWHKHLTCTLTGLNQKQWLIIPTNTLNKVEFIFNLRISTALVIYAHLLRHYNMYSANVYSIFTHDSVFTETQIKYVFVYEEYYK